MFIFQSLGKTITHELFGSVKKKLRGLFYSSFFLGRVRLILSNSDFTRVQTKMVGNRFMLGIAKRIHGLSAHFQISLIFLSAFFCPVLWAAQDGIVIVDRAVIYADKTMTSPVGYILKGKRVTIGEVPRNKARVYPIVVSGKVAYIRVIDVNTELESVESNRLVAERFIRASQKKIEGSYGASIFTYPTQLSINSSPGDLENNSPFVFNGVQVRGLAKNKASRWDLGVVFGYAEGQERIETFRMIELGGEFSVRIYSGDRFILRWQNQLLSVPFATYSLGSKARVNGYGLSAGTGLNANVILGNKFGLEAYGGFYYTKLFGFDLPDPRNATLPAGATKFADLRLSPSFIGTRIGVGFTYLY